MGKLNKIISPLEGFQYSVNIAYDIYDDRKISSYIPSESSLRIIEDILKSADNKSNERARILTGAYGKGKSHLILHILALLTGRNPDLFKILINKAERLDKYLANNIRRYIESGKKLLPVIVNANSTDLKSTLLQSLSIALQQAGLSDIMPTTFFDVAVAKIQGWKQDFPETYKLFESKVGQSGESFIKKLNDYNHSSYELFVKIYPSLTSGSDFNPLAGADVIGVYDSVIKAIKERGYTGIYVVYDEFGKYLESIVDKPSAMDIKIMQDLAERCERSGSDQFHLMLISHKGIENYIGKLPKEKVDSWKGISNRFHHITINNDEAEIYDMIATVLLKNETKFKQYVGENKDKFENLKSLVDKGHSFSEVCKKLGNDLSLSCYPLHPYSVLLLPKVSELVAQNERTIFTFLASTERFTVPYFIGTDNADFPLIEPDYIYDYFESLFKGEPYGSDIKTQWQITSAALAKIREYDNPLAEKIVKTISLIYCVNDFEIIPPSWDIICDIYGINYSLAEIESAKEVLKKCNVLIELLYKPYVRITQGSGHDVLGMIKEERYAIENKIAIPSVLNQISNVKYIYPVQYNDEYEVTRYFDFKFINVYDLDEIAKDGFELQSNADGVVYAILVGTDTEQEYARTKILQMHNRRALFVLPKSAFELKAYVIEYQAIKNLISKYKDTELELLDELNFILEDRTALISTFIDKTYIQVEYGKSEIFYNGEVKSIIRKAQLSGLLSNVISNIFDKTPIVVNDLINKNEISGTIKNARTKLINALLTPPYSKNLGMIGNGPELNLFRSVLLLSGILDEADEPIINFNCEDDRTRVVLNEIVQFMEAAHTEETGNLSVLYDILKNPEHGYGIKNGLIPIYIAVVLTQFKDHLSITKRGREIPLTASLLSDIDISPKDYCIKVETWDDSKDNYIANLEQIFNQYINNSDKTGSSFTYIVRAMRRWYLHMTKFESTSKVYCDDKLNEVEYDKATIRFRNALSNPELNAHEFLFDKLFGIFNKKGFNELIKCLRDSYNNLNSSYINYHRLLIKQIKDLFNATQDLRLSSVLANYYDDLQPATKEHLFSGKVSMFLNIAKHPNNDEFKLVEDIARALFNLRMDDFSDEIMKSYIRELESVKELIDKYNCEKHSDGIESGSYKIVFVDSNGSEVTRQFDGIEDTYNGGLFYNELTSIIDDFGESITSDEKRQILFRILKDLV